MSRKWKVFIPVVISFLALIIIIGFFVFKGLSMRMRSPGSYSEPNPAEEPEAAYVPADDDEAADEDAAEEDLPKPVSRIDPIALIDRALERFDTANIAFNTPDNLNISESSLIELRLSLRKSVKELKAEIVEQGEAVGESIKVSARMEARLSGQMFEILAVTTRRTGAIPC